MDFFLKLFKNSAQFEIFALKFSECFIFFFILKIKPENRELPGNIKFEPGITLRVLENRNFKRFPKVSKIVKTVFKKLIKTCSIIMKKSLF